MGKRNDKIKDFLRAQKQELQKILLEKKDKLRQLRFDLSAGKVKNIREIRETKKDIARIMTILKSKLPVK